MMDLPVSGSMRGDRRELWRNYFAAWSAGAAFLVLPAFLALTFLAGLAGLAVSVFCAAGALELAGAAGCAGAAAFCANAAPIAKLAATRVAISFFMIHPQGLFVDILYAFV
jgi:hypothetical protein